MSLVIITEEQINGWNFTFPELKTRKLLLDYCISHPNFRKKLFHLAELLISTKYVPETHKLHILNLAYSFAKSRMEEWREHLEKNSKELFNEMWGFIRNIFNNLIHTRNAFHRHDVKVFRHKIATFEMETK